MYPLLTDSLPLDASFSPLSFYFSGGGGGTPESLGCAIEHLSLLYLKQPEEVELNWSRNKFKRTETK